MSTADTNRWQMLETWIVFNGEIYNFQELRNQVNTRFETKSDTEVS